MKIKGFLEKKFPTKFSFGRRIYATRAGSGIFLSAHLCAVCGGSVKGYQMSISQFSMGKWSISVTFLSYSTFCDDL
jgi:hypothetical protein